MQNSGMESLDHWHCYGIQCHMTSTRHSGSHAIETSGRYCLFIYLFVCLLACLLVRSLIRSFSDWMIFMLVCLSESYSN